MKVYGFSEKDSERIKHSVRHYEGYYRLPGPARPRYPVGAGSSAIPAKAPAAAVAAGSVTTPTAFTATLYQLGGTGGGLTASSTTVTAYNPFTSGIAANSLIWLASFGGNYYVVAANC